VSSTEAEVAHRAQLNRFGYFPHEREYYSLGCATCATMALSGSQVLTRNRRKGNSLGIEKMEARDRSRAKAK
jgi:hypothetical protein